MPSMSLAPWIATKREKGTRGIIAECQMDPCRTSGTPRGTSYYSFVSSSPDEFVGPACELAAPRVNQIEQIALASQHAARPPARLPEQAGRYCQPRCSCRSKPIPPRAFPQTSKGETCPATPCPLRYRRRSFILLFSEGNTWLAGLTAIYSHLIPVIRVSNGSFPKLFKAEEDFRL